MSQRRLLEQELAPVAQGVPETEAERDAIREQLERILANPLFTHSKRYPLLLRSVVERTLAGHSGQLKERTLGVEVFGRHPDYDTNTDPVVRITAGEIRKRIAQYYHEPGHENEYRIDLPCGSYVPEFHRPVQPDLQVLPRPVVLPQAVVPPVTKVRRIKPVYLGALALPPLVWLVVWLFSATSLDRFWRPVWDSPGSALLCIGGAGIAPDAALPPTPSNPEISVTEKIRREYVDFSDATTFSRLAGLFQARGKRYSMRIGSSTTFADLRDGPVVLVGGFNNGWTMHLLGQLRFRLARDPATGAQWIEDRQNPSQREWSVNANLPYLKLTEDYAIISRVLDPATERMVVVAAGIVQYGTLAAGEFLTDPRYMEDLGKQAPPNWQRKNMQAVIGTKVINGNSGPPRILKTYFW
ncbi:MAG: hypothetical protein LAQ69_15495 [Acidobacteriia bacterium]|nr:hypothetical protein [Terriglobia bacterium]